MRRAVSFLSAFLVAVTAWAAPVELNTATAAELAKLPGLGKKSAVAVVAHREKAGPFQKIEDLDKVKGVGKGTIDKLRAAVTVNGVAPAPAKEKAAKAKDAAPGEKLDVNTATVKQLDKLPGIGKGKAKAIVEHREKNGAFKAVDDLSSVKGISKKLVDELRELVIVK